MMLAHTFKKGRQVSLGRFLKSFDRGGLPAERSVAASAHVDADLAHKSSERRRRDQNAWLLLVVFDLSDRGST